MIQPLRTQHRVTFVILAVIIPVVFVAALASRPKPARMERRGLLVASNSIINSQNGLFRTATNSNADGSSSIRLLTHKPILAPDVLVYFAESKPQQNDLPPTAYLLGEFEPYASYPMPVTPGFIVLYSPAQKSVIDIAPLGGRP